MTTTFTNNMQLIGDDPPGDDDFYDDLEDEEAQRATNTDRIANASTWDPEKMEMVRMIDRLWRRGGKWLLKKAGPLQAVPHKVRLPAFWRKVQPPGFKLAEVLACKVPYTVLLHIPHHILERNLEPDRQGCGPIGGTEGPTGGASYSKSPGPQCTSICVGQKLAAPGLRSSWRL